MTNIQLKCFNCFLLEKRFSRLNHFNWPQICERRIIVMNAEIRITSNIYFLQNAPHIEQYRICLPIFRYRPFVVVFYTLKTAILDKKFWLCHWWQRLGTSLCRYGKLFRSGMGCSALQHFTRWCARCNHEDGAWTPIWPGSRGSIRTLEARVLDCLWCNLKLTLKHFSTRYRINIRGGGGGWLASFLSCFHLWLGKKD